MSLKHIFYNNLSIFLGEFESMGHSARTTMAEKFDCGIDWMAAQFDKDYDANNAEKTAIAAEFQPRSLSAYR